MIADILSARLGALGDLIIVERQDIEKILTEQKLTLAGLVSPDKAVQVGKMLGAQLLITGRVTSTGTRIYVICKVINAETSQVKGFFLSLEQNVSFDDLLDKTGGKLSKSLPAWTKQLIPPERRKPGDVAVLKKLLANKALPTVAIIVPEQHIGRAVIDPAVETEFKMLLTRAGVKPVELSESAIKTACQDLKDLARLSRLLAGTRYLICGEAFSERGGTIHGLIVGVGRVELQIIDLQSGKILIADRETGRAPDLSEHLAGKTALQKAGRKLAMRMLPKLIKQLPKVEKKQTGEEVINHKPEEANKSD